MRDRRIVFLGTPEAAARVLRGLLDDGREVVLVVTAPDKRRGRGGALLPTPVKTVARQAGIPVAHDLDALSTVAGPSLLGVVVAYGRLIPADVLERTAMLNVHFSLLPRWRGAAPVERAILAGDEETGVCIMRMDAGLDTGHVLATARTAIEPQDTTATLMDRLVTLSLPLLRGCLDAEDLVGVPQRGDPVYAAKIAANEGEIDWSRSSEDIVRRVRALRCHTHLAGRRIGIVAVAPVAGVEAPQDGPEEPGAVTDDARVRTGDGWVRLVAVRPEGRPTMDGVEWRRGLRATEPRFRVSR